MGSGSGNEQRQKATWIKGAGLLDPPEGATGGSGLKKFEPTIFELVSGGRKLHQGTEKNQNQHGI